MKDGWYLCDPDWDEALGPMPRDQLDRMLAGKRVPDTALAWHIDISEWRRVSPLSAPHPTEAPANPTEARHKPSKQDATGKHKQRASATPNADHNRQQAKQTRAAQNERHAQEVQAAKRKQEKSQNAARNQVAQAEDAAEKVKAAQAFALIALRRLGARMIDVLLVMPILAAVFYGWLKVSMVDANLSEPHAFGLIWLGVLLSLPVEALLLSMFGTTIGKAAFGLRVVNLDDRNPGLGTAWRRQFSVILRGMALGIPGISFIASLVAGVQTLSNKVAPWDQAQRLRVLASPFTGLRAQIAIVLVIVALAFAGNEGVLSVFERVRSMFYSIESV